MSPPSSPVSPDVVRKVAALARLDLPDAELSGWTEQLGRIVSYIDQLKQLPEGQLVAAHAPATPLRADVPMPGEGRRALEENARLLHEHGVVPRVVAGTSSEAGSEPDALRRSAGPVPKEGSKSRDAR